MKNQYYGKKVKGWLYDKTGKIEIIGIATNPKTTCHYKIEITEEEFINAPLLTRKNHRIYVPSTQVIEL